MADDWSAAHDGCNNAGKHVTCDRCGRTYICTPWADFYCTPKGDHCCEPCLLGGMELTVIDPETAAGPGGGGRG